MNDLWIRHTGPNPFLLLSMACEANLRRQADIPVPKSYGGKNPALLLVSHASSEKNVTFPAENMKMIDTCHCFIASSPEEYQFRNHMQKIDQNLNWGGGNAVTRGISPR